MTRSVEEEQALAVKPDGAFYDPVSMQGGLISTVNFTSPVSWVLSGNFTVPATGFTSLTAVQTLLLPICMTNSTYRNESYSSFR